MSDFEEWFEREVAGNRIYNAVIEKERMRISWNAAIEASASLCDDFDERVLKPADKHIDQDVDCYPETAAACAKAIRSMKG